MNHIDNNHILQAMGIQRWQPITTHKLDNPPHKNVHAKLMIVSHQEEPHVGKDNQLLDAMLASIGLDRSNTHITTVLKHETPEGKESCASFLIKQIALVQPDLILAMGDIAAHSLLNTTTPLAELRGKIHTHGQDKTPVIVTYHPMHLLHTPKDKGKAFQDLQMVQRRLIDNQ